jgi:hypothetical protein
MKPMKKLTSTLKTVFSTPVLVAVLLGIVAAVAPDLVLAQYYGGPGILGGISHAEQIGGVSTLSIRDIILNLLLAVLIFMGLAAVVVIVIAGIMLVISVGDEQAKEKAKKIITYAIIGLILIAIAAGIVNIIIGATGGANIFGPVPTLNGTATGTDIRVVIRDILTTVLGFMALAAVVVIVIAGILMVVSLGDEQAKDRAKRIILYAVIGLFIILFARAIVKLVEFSVTN